MPQAIQALLWREMALARKQGGGLGAALSFLLAVIVLVPLAVGPDLALLQRLAGGMMWLALLLAVLLTADRMFQQDLEDGSLDLLTMSALPFEVITLVKAFAHWLGVSLPLALMAPPLALMMNLPLATLPVLWLSMVTGSLALSMLASIGGAITAGLRRGSLLVSIVILPLYVPVLIFGVSATTLMMGPQTSTPSLLMLLAITLVSLAMAPVASAAALRSYLR